jgi:hypothetical protein
MIPAFMATDSDGHATLPAGQHLSDWETFARRFGYNIRRRKLLKGLVSVLNQLYNAQCEEVYIDGSFVTTKEVPNDIDLAYKDNDGRVFQYLSDNKSPLADFEDILQGRTLQKRYYGCECLPAHWPATSPNVGLGMSYYQFFQQTRDGAAKGVIVLSIADLPASMDVSVYNYEVNDDS